MAPATRSLHPRRGTAAVVGLPQLQRFRLSSTHAHRSAVAHCPDEPDQPAAGGPEGCSQLIGLRWPTALLSASIVVRGGDEIRKSLQMTKNVTAELALFERR